MKLTELLNVLQEFPGHDYNAVTRVVQQKPKKPSKLASLNVFRINTGIVRQSLPYEGFVISFDRTYDEELFELNIIAPTHISGFFHNEYLIGTHAMLVDGDFPLIPKPSAYRIVEDIGKAIAKKEGVGIGFDKLTGTEEELLTEHGIRATHGFSYRSFSGGNEEVRRYVPIVVGCRDGLVEVMKTEERKVIEDIKMQENRLRDILNNIILHREAPAPA